jgi:hypothetical protein
VRRFLKVKKRTHFIDANLLLLDHLFNLADFLLDFARELLVLARGRETGVVGDLPRILWLCLSMHAACPESGPWCSLSLVCLSLLFLPVVI